MVDGSNPRLAKKVYRVPYRPLWAITQQIQEEISQVPDSGLRLQLRQAWTNCVHFAIPRTDKNDMNWVLGAECITALWTMWLKAKAQTIETYRGEVLPPGNTDGEEST